MQCYNIRGYKDKFAKLPFTLSNCSYYDLQQKLARMSIRSKGGPAYMNVKRIWKFYDDTIYLQMKRSLIDIHDSNRPAYGNELRRALYNAKDCYIKYDIGGRNENAADMEQLRKDAEDEAKRERKLREKAEEYSVDQRKRYINKHAVYKQFADYFGSDRPTTRPEVGTQTGVVGARRGRVMNDANV